MSHIATYAVGREKVREYAYATGETDPRCLDLEAARTGGFDDLLAPPMFAAVYCAPAIGTPSRAGNNAEAGPSHAQGEPAPADRAAPLIDGRPRRVESRRVLDASGPGRGGSWSTCPAGRP